MRNLLLLLIFNSALTYAKTYAEANLKFSATVVQTTCDVNTNSKNLTVELGRYAIKNFRLPDSKSSSPKYFEIYLNNCNAVTTSIKFTGNPDAMNPSFLAVSTPENSIKAQNIAIRILDKNQHFLPLNTYSPSIAPDSSGSVTFGFYAEYISENGGVTAGNADAFANFILQYQ